MFYTRGLKLKSYAGQTDNFEIYGGPHVIFSKRWQVFCLKLNTILRLLHIIIIIISLKLLHCYLFADVCCTFSFSSGSPIQYNSPFKKLLRKLLDFMLQILLHC
jgi:hypothetical protein